MKEHTLRLCTLLWSLAVLVPVYSVQASTQFIGLYRYEVDPWGGTNVHDARIEMNPAGDQAYTGDEAVAALVYMNGYADGDWKRVKFFDPEQGVLFDRMTTYEGSTNCFVLQTFHSPPGTSQTCLTEQRNSAGFYSVTEEDPLWQNRHLELRGHGQ